jgi:hypothetical protein
VQSTTALRDLIAVVVQACNGRREHGLFVVVQGNRLLQDPLTQNMET